MHPERTRIAGLNFSDKRPVLGEDITIAGYLQWYDQKGKRWEPVERKRIELYIDNVKMAESNTDYSGSFEFEHSIDEPGEHVVEVKFPGFREYFLECSKARTLRAITAEEKRRIEKLTNIVFLSALLLILLLIIFSFWFSK
jgi:hypothetical protein